MTALASRTNIYIALVLGLGWTTLLYGIWDWHPQNWIRTAVYCVIAVFASGMKVTLPGVTGTMSMNFVFALIGVVELSRAETLAIGCLGALIQCTLHTNARPQAIKIFFSIASIAISLSCAFHIYHAAFLGAGPIETPVRVLIAAGVYFTLNTFSIAMVVALTEHQGAWTVWRRGYFWSFPNYLVGAAIAWGMTAVSRSLGWQSALVLLPILYVLFRSYSQYVTRVQEEKGRAEEQRNHAEQVASLHWRTIEVLALAIECKDQTTHDHLERVQVYALKVGKELGLTAAELEALRAAALLHDIGKLAVPEYIISKPGRLTPEEFAKMKVHPVVGAEILEQVQFPYPVAPIVRSHHEKWDGTGYPDGLSGVKIPIGARILSAVDCLDALASDRQYRRALPLDQAIEIVKAEAGRSFDPVVVEVLAHRYVELERMAKGAPGPAKPKLSTDVTVERGAAPAAGFESNGVMNLRQALTAAAGISAGLQELAADLEECPTRDEVLDLLRTRLGAIVGYDAMAVYRRIGEGLMPECVDGDDYRLFASLEIPLGMGLSGWVAENGKPVLNGNPSVEPGYMNDPTKFSTLRSALAVPLESADGIIGVLSLYRRERDGYTAGQMKALHTFGASLGRSLGAKATESR